MHTPCQDSPQGEELLAVIVLLEEAMGSTEALQSAMLVHEAVSIEKDIGDALRELLASVAGDSQLTQLAQAIQGYHLEAIARLDQGAHQLGGLSQLCNQMGGVVRAALVQLEAQADGVFRALDTNGDGALADGELEAALSDFGVEGEEADALLLSLDTNSDGQVDAREFCVGYTEHNHPALGAVIEFLTDLEAVHAGTTPDSNDHVSSTIDHPQPLLSTRLILCCVLCQNHSRVVLGASWRRSHEASWRRSHEASWRKSLEDHNKRRTMATCFKVLKA